MNRSPRPAADTVLVLTEPGDTTADLVTAELDRLGARTVRFDPGDFPRDAEIDAWFDGTWHGQIRGPGGTADLDDIRSVYVRRPSKFAFHPGMTDAERRFADREARRGLGGILMSLPCAWMNHPARAADAEFKPLQYAVAAACGLTVPATTITNAPACSRDHAARLGPAIVCKTLASATVVDGDHVAHVWTTPVTADDLADPRVAHTAHQFQQRIPKTRDVRATVVGDRVLAADILIYRADGLLDWRADYAALRHEPTALPADVEQALLRTTRRFGLTFAAADFVVTDDGRHTFVDLNPGGQFGWIEEAAGLPIAAAIAEELTRDLSANPSPEPTGLSLVPGPQPGSVASPERGPISAM